MNNTEQSNQLSGQLYTVSAPSGAGKTSLVKALVQDLTGIGVSVSHTTRPMRSGEVNGVNYHFIDDEQFCRMESGGEFLEHATVFTNRYGTSRTEVERLLAQGNDVILEIDWQGAAQIKQQMSATMAIFILPPSLEALQERLTGRGQDDESVINKRMQAAVDEISHYAAADYLIVNEVFDTALAELKNIILAGRLNQQRQQQAHEKLLNDLLA